MKSLFFVIHLLEIGGVLYFSRKLGIELDYLKCYTDTNLLGKFSF
jgi:hypothetical protein